MVKKSRYDTINISLRQSTRSKLAAFQGAISHTIRDAVDLYWGHPYIVVSVTNIENGRVLYAMLNTFQNYNMDYVEKLSWSSSPIGIDMRSIGYCNFELKTIGVFKIKVDALDMRDYYINKKLNEGGIVYNDEIFNGSIPRYITTPISNSNYLKLVNICFKKKIKIEKLFSKFVSKYINKHKEIYGKNN